MQTALFVCRRYFFVRLFVLLQSLSLLGFKHEFVMLLLLRCFARRSLRFKSREIREDYLEEVHDGATFWEHTLVRLVEGFGRILRRGVLLHALVPLSLMFLPH